MRLSRAIALGSVILLACSSTTNDVTLDEDGNPITPGGQAGNPPGPGAVDPITGEPIVPTDGPPPPPSSTDGVQNADESDVDCGGTGTAAPKCDGGKKCNARTDCASDVCMRDGPGKGTCTADATPSCGTYYGGQTCGAGEVGQGAAQHESCCKTLPVATSFEDRLHPGKRVYLDKYEITAGRMREFLTRMEETYGGQARVQTWLKANMPAFWNDSADVTKNWTRWLPEGKSTELPLPRFNTYLPPGDSPIADPWGDVGSDYILGPNGWYFYTHGHNCDASAYPTYWYPEDVWKDKHGGNPARRMTKEQLDVRSLNCAPPALLAAFCAWDGGQLATVSVLAEVTGVAYGSRSTGPCTSGAGCVSSWRYGTIAGSRFPLLTQNSAAMTCANQESCPSAKPCPGSDGCAIANFSNDAGQLFWGPAVPYYYRPGVDDYAARIAAPGRMTGDRVVYNAGDEPWMDLRGNLQELSLDDRTANTYAFGGVHYDSVGRRAKGAGNQIQPEFKIAQAGARCMRFRDE